MVGSNKFGMDPRARVLRHVRHDREALRVLRVGRAQKAFDSDRRERDVCTPCDRAGESATLR